MFTLTTKGKQFYDDTTYDIGLGRHMMVRNYPRANNGWAAYSNPSNNWRWFRHINDPRTSMVHVWAEEMVLRLLRRTYMTKSQIVNAVRHLGWIITPRNIYIIENLDLILTNFWIKGFIQKGHLILHE